MARLGTREPLYYGLATFQSGKVYDPSSIARRIVNFGRNPDGTIETIDNLARYDPVNGTSLSGPLLAVGHVETLDGANQVTVVRSNRTLYRHQGWTRTYQALNTTLTYDANQPFPDVCLPINGKIVWSNGYDRPLVVDASKEYGRLCVPLGFALPPAAPIALSPSPGGIDGNGSTSSIFEHGAGAGVYAPNMGGYSVPGNIGTVAAFQGEDGSLLSSAYLYALQWEDVHGNLSPLSTPSNVATIQDQSTGYVAPASGNYVRKNKLDMLRRGFAVRGFDQGEDHVKAIRLYRTTDTLHTDGKYHLVARIEGRQKFVYPDSMSDADLVNSDTPQRPVPVEPFRVACEYQGRLVIGNLASEAGMLRWSEPGFIGTFLEDSWIVPDSGGAQITALVSFAGAVLVFTDSSIFRLDLDAEGPRLRPIVTGIGCVAPQSAQTLPDGRLIFLSRASIYALSQDGTLEDIGQDVWDITSRINSGRVGRAAAGIDPQTGEYLLAIPVDSHWNTTIIGYDFRVRGWKSYDLTGPFAPVSMHAAAGRAGHLLVGAYLVGGSHELRVWNRPDVSSSRDLTCIFESNELRLDPQGLKVFRVKQILVGFIESDAKTDDPGLTVKIWTTSRRTGTTPADSSYETEMEMVGQDFGLTWSLGELTLNTTSPDTNAYFRTPQVTWRVIQVDRAMLTGLRFQLYTTQAARRVHLHGIAIIAEEQGQEASRVPGPTRSV